MTVTDDFANPFGSETTTSRPRPRPRPRRLTSTDVVTSEDAAGDETTLGRVVGEVALPGDAEVLDLEEDAEEPAAPSAEPVRPARSLVRGALLRGLREQGEVQPGQPGALDDHVGGADLRGRHPDGGRHRVQGRPATASCRRRCTPATCSSAWTSTTTPGTSCATRPGSPASSARAAPSPPRCSRKEVEDILGVEKAEGARGREEGPAPGRVRGGRAGPGRHRSVRRLQRRDLRDRRRSLEAQGARQHLRSRDPGRARVRPGREALDETKREKRLHGEAREMAKKKLAPSCGSRSRPARRRPRRRSVPRSVRTGSRSWTSARRTTPRPRTSAAW